MNSERRQDARRVSRRAAERHTVNGNAAIGFSAVIGLGLIMVMVRRARRPAQVGV